MGWTKTGLSEHCTADGALPVIGHQVADTLRVEEVETRQELLLGSHDLREANYASVFLPWLISGSSSTSVARRR